MSTTTYERTSGGLTPEEIDFGWVEHAQHYGGNWFAYNFETALTEADERAKERKRAAKQLTADDEAEATRLCWLTHFPEAPTPEALRRHGERFGPEGVQQIADVYGVDLTVTTRTQRGKGRKTGKRGLKQADRLAEAA